MIGIEFRLRISSAYSIRVPYSYQCARTYPLPAPSTIKGLCANAVWRSAGGNPVELMAKVNEAAAAIFSRSENPIAVSSCTVRVVPTDALIREFAFTPSIDCLIIFRDGENDLMKKITEALRIAPVYLGDSESLVCVETESIHSNVEIVRVSKGNNVSVNSLFRYDLMDDNNANDKGTILYMQDDPCSADAVLERYVAPLKQNADTYYPINALSFTTAKDTLYVEGKRLKGIIPLIQSDVTVCTKKEKS